jgi:hypothetical protein
MNTFTMNYDLDEEHLTQLNQIMQINNINNKWELNNKNNIDSNVGQFNYDLIPSQEFSQVIPDNINLIDIKIKNEARNKAIYNIICNKLKLLSIHNLSNHPTIPDSICAICQDNLDDSIKTIPCGHSYHVNCIAEWLYEKWNRYEIPISDQKQFNTIYECPLCKTYF